MSERGHFGSKLGVVLASAGSAVGLGNIWRFPTETGSNGGAAFILVYLMCVFFIGMPVMMSEFVIGRASHSNTVDAYKRLSKSKWWAIAGYIGVVGGFMVLSYYSVVAGWTVKYTFDALTCRISWDADHAAAFSSFVSSPVKSTVSLAVFLGLTHLVVVRGIHNGIERYSRLMMPMLLLILVILVGCSLTMPGAAKGIEFLLRPDFSKVTASVVLSAMGQAFFSLSLGIGCLVTYASYFSKETNLTRLAFSVCSIDTLVAVMSGFIIFPTVMSVPGATVDAGPGLVFITLPHVFQSTLAGMPVLCYAASVMFYVLLLLAALTSSISLHEICTAFLIERYGLSRKNAAISVTAVCAVLGIVCSLSFGLWSGYTCMGMGVFDWFDFLSAKFVMPLGGLLITVFVGWKLKRSLVHDEVTNGGKVSPTLFGMYMFLVRYIVPIGICAIFINELAK